MGGNGKCDCEELGEARRQMAAQLRTGHANRETGPLPGSPRGIAGVRDIAVVPQQVAACRSGISTDIRRGVALARGPGLGDRGRGRYCFRFSVPVSAT
jgi:hypothetical protein